MLVDFQNVPQPFKATNTPVSEKYQHCTMIEAQFILDKFVKIHKKSHIWCHLNFEDSSTKVTKIRDNLSLTKPVNQHS